MVNMFLLRLFCSVMMWQKRYRTLPQLTESAKKLLHLLAVPVFSFNSVTGIQKIAGGGSGPTTTTSHEKKGQLQVTEPVTLNPQVSNSGSYNYFATTPLKAGRLKYISAAWSKITSDPWILQAIQGVKI